MKKITVKIENVVKGTVFSICIISFFGCESIRLSNGGAKNPDVETASSLNAYLKAEGMEKELNFIPKFQSLYSIILSGISPTTVYVFDKKGREIRLPIASNKCGLEPALFIKALRADKEYPIIAGLIVDSLQQWLTTVEQKDAILTDDIVNADFYVVVFWAVWAGEKVFQRDIVSTVNAAKENQQAKIKLALVNLDKQASWGEENLKKVSFTKKGMNILY
jgi:hypothetical protein